MAKKKPRLIDELPDGPNCATCPYRSTSRGFTKPQLKPESIYVALGEASGYWEINDREPFAGQSGGSLNAKLGLADLTRMDISIVNSVCCRPIEWVRCSECGGSGEITHTTHVEETEYGEIAYADTVLCDECGGNKYVAVKQGDGDHKNATPEPGQIIECMNRYGHDILKSLTKKKLIISLGTSALYALTGEDAIGDLRGSVLDTSHGPALITYHPAFLMRDQRMEPAVMRDFSRIRAIAAGTEGRGLDINYQKHPKPEVIRALKGTKSFVLDLETSGGKDPDENGTILLAAISRQPGEGIVVDPGRDLAEILDGAEEVIGQYFYIYDAWWLHKRGYRVPPVIIDTQVLGHAANPSTPNDITTLQSEYADPPMREFWKREEDYQGDIAGVAIRDVDSTKRTELGLTKHLKYAGQWQMVEEIIIPWTRLSFELRRDGIRVDLPLLQTEAARIKEEVWAGGEALAKATGCPMPKKTVTGIPSPLNVQKYLYDELKLPIQYDRKKPWKRTAAEPALRRLRSWCWKNQHKEGLYFLDNYIGQKDNPGLKQQSTLAKDFAKYGKYGEEWIHAIPNLTGTVNGRLSYIDPNLQQVPPRVRRAFLPDNEDHLFINLDYKQIEYLVLLYEAQEWELLRQGLDGRDFHRLAAASIFNTPFDSVTKQQRSNVKPINLGVLYGKGAHSTAEDMDCEVSEVQGFFDGFHKMVPGLKPYQRKEVAEVRRNGYVQTEFGWRRYFSRDESHNTQRKSVETEIFNARIQSNAGLATRAKIIELWRQISTLRDVGVRIVLSVHDSVLLTTPLSHLAEVKDALIDVMCSPVKQLPAPDIGMPDGIRFPVDIEVGKTWGGLVSWEQWQRSSH